MKNTNGTNFKNVRIFLPHRQPGRMQGPSFQGWKTSLNHLQKLTCDDAGEGAAHSHWGEGGGGPTEGCHDWWRPTEGSEAGCVAVVAVVVCLHSWRMTHQGGVGPIVAQVGVDRRGIWVIGSVLQGRALVLFTPYATHRQACRQEKEKEDLIRHEFGCIYGGLDICRGHIHLSFLLRLQVALWVM